MESTDLRVDAADTWGMYDERCSYAGYLCKLDLMLQRVRLRAETAVAFGILIQ